MIAVTNGGAARSQCPARQLIRVTNDSEMSCSRKRSLHSPSEDAGAYVSRHSTPAAGIWAIRDRPYVTQPGCLPESEEAGGTDGYATPNSHRNGISLLPRFQSNRMMGQNLPGLLGGSHGIPHVFPAIWSLPCTGRQPLRPCMLVSGWRFRHSYSISAQPGQQPVVIETAEGQVFSASSPQAAEAAAMQAQAAKASHGPPGGPHASKPDGKPPGDDEKKKKDGPKEGGPKDGKSEEAETVKRPPKPTFAPNPEELTVKPDADGRIDSASVGSRGRTSCTGSRASAG